MNSLFLELGHVLLCKATIIVPKSHGKQPLKYWIIVIKITSGLIRQFQQ